MGPFDSFMPGESMGMPDGGMPNYANGLLNNPALQMGLGILANNQGNYGSFGAAIGKGGLMGLSNLQRQQEALRQQKLMDMHMKQLQMQQDKQKKLDEWQQSYGIPNADATIQGGYANAPQGTDAPNFNMVKQPDTVQPNASFDQNKWLMSGIGTGAVSPIDVMKMQRGEADYGYSDGVLYDKKSGKYQQIGGGNDKSLDTPDIKGYNFARTPEGGNFQGSFQQYLQIKPSAMMPIQQAQLGIAQDNLGIKQREADYSLPSAPKAAKSFSVSVGGKTYTFPDQKSLNNFKLKAGVR